MKVAQGRPLPRIKRIFDLTVVVVCLFFLVPFLLTFAVLIRLRLGSPVLFRQMRPGYLGKPFTLYKFRTMTDEKDEHGNLLPDSQRLTRFGGFLRRSSLDELPELLNILRGDMSLVGPRPLLMQYLPRYSAEQARRHHVLPGLTGWAQVNGRNALSWEDKFSLDVWYVDHWSMQLDLKILWQSIWKVLKREGIEAPDQVTPSEFMGSPGNSSNGENK
jgi:lipopolysaccharide/colanic/teichoic acid biosynthesis glycosyltransferase